MGASRAIWRWRGAARRVAGCVLVAVWVTGWAGVVYETGFEGPEFELDYTVEGQGGWTCFPAEASGGSAVVTNYFEGWGQQALLGFYTPANTNGPVSIFPPLNVDPVAIGKPVVGFRVTMAVFDPEPPEENRDSFRWSVYNLDGVRLFSLDFDNRNGEITYQLEGDTSPFVPTGYYFDVATPYDLEMRMDFASNRWTATFGGVVLAENQPITQLPGKTRLNLGDIDAVWIKGYENPALGGNYMVFDDYRVVADVAVPEPCRLEVLGVVPGVGCVVRCHGEAGRTYAVEVSSDLVEWVTLAVNMLVGSSFEVVDAEAALFPTGFYRGAALWP